jgi:glycosyltransferase involved in cell wall biosynthesis
MAVAEAMSAGLPVVISDQVKIWREVAGAGAGLVTRCDPSEIAAALRELLDDPDRRHRLGRAGRAIVDEKFSWDVVMDQLVSTFREVVAKARQPVVDVRPRDAAVQR